MTLFFDNQIHVNVNDYFTEPIIQERALRQGEPPLPAALQPCYGIFLLHILKDDC